MDKPTIEAEGADSSLATVERAPDQLAKSMPEWFHTHDLIFRKRTWPVMSKVYCGMQLMFRADGMIEWMRHPLSGWAFRGQPVQGVSLRSVIFGNGKKYNPELPAPPPTVPGMKAAE